jgi:4-hydroxy-tetrahydrodipicolinate synthase
MVTPFDVRGQVDVKQAQRLALALLDSGSDGVVVTGTTGEAPTLSKDEKLELYAAIKEAVGKRGTVIANSGSYSTRESVELTERAEKTGVDAVMAVVPYYNRPTQEGLYQHFQTVAKATKLPLILYNVPSRTVTSLSAETTVRLSRDVPNIIGVKEASGNLEQIGRIIKEAKPGFLLYSGNDGDTFPIMAMGGHGVISVASHLVGRQMKEMIELVVKGEGARAAQVHLRLLPLFNAMFIVPNPIPIKHALNKVGFPVGGFRLPLTPPDPKSAEAIDAVLKGYTIDLPTGARVQN